MFGRTVGEGPRCELNIDGPLAASVAEVVAARFGPVVAEPAPCGRRTTLVVDGLDPAAERALLTLLWDTGHDVVAFRSSR